MVLPSAFSIFSSFSVNLNRDIQAGNEGKSLGSQVIERNVDDLYLLATNNWEWETSSIVNAPELTEDTVVNSRLEINPKYIQVTDILAPDKVPNGEVLKYRINESEQATEKEGSLKVFGKIIQMFDNRYYRYRVHWLPLFSELIIFIIAMTISAFKFSLIIWKMMGDYMLLAVGGYADILGLSRVKLLVQEILGSLGLIVYMPLLFQVFTISQEIIRSSNFSFFSWFFATLGSAYLLIDGPNGFAKIMGIDAGLKTAGQLFMGAMSAIGVSKVAGGIGRAASNAGKSVGGALASGAGQLGFAGAGMAVEGMSQGIAALAEKRKGKQGDKEAPFSENEDKKKENHKGSIADLASQDSDKENKTPDNQSDPEEIRAGQLNQDGLSQDIGDGQAQPDDFEGDNTNTPVPISDGFDSLMATAPPEVQSERDNASTPETPVVLSSPMDAQERQGKPQTIDKSIGSQSEESGSDDQAAPSGNPLGNYLKERANIRVMGHGLDDFRNTKGQQSRRKMVESFRKGRESVRYEQDFQRKTAQGRASLEGEANFNIMSQENKNLYQDKETRQARQARENLLRKTRK
ncbi:hypothetical protein RyT2_28240 [Pseudolactococcus yaeyamensis]